MIYQLPTLVVFIGHTSVLIITYFLGVWVTQWRLKSQKRPGSKNEVSMIIEATLLSFLLGFTFNTAFEKSVSRKTVFNNEINQISTVYSLSSLYPIEVRKEFNGIMNNYVAQRIAYFNAGEDEAKISRHLQVGEEISEKAYEFISKYALDKSVDLYPREMIPALNSLFDTASTREMLRKSRVPLPAMRLLLLISVLVSFISGIKAGSERNHWITVIGFALLVSMTLYLILDFDSPRSGFFTLAEQQQELITLFNEVNRPLHIGK